jgi:hypothetical protein
MSSNEVFANPLLVHMTVLLARLGEGVADAHRPTLRSRVLEGLLRRERQRWSQNQPEAAVIDLASPLAAQAVSVATLTSPKTRADLVELLQAIPDLADASRERRGRIADWLHQLYPADGGAVAPLRPDPLAEQQLADTPDLAQLGVNLQQRATSTSEVAQLLAELTRAAPAQPAVRAALDRLLDAACLNC